MHRILLRKSQSISPKQVFLASGCEMAFRYLRSRLQLFSAHFRASGGEGFRPWWRQQTGWSASKLGSSAEDCGGLTGMDDQGQLQAFPPRPNPLLEAITCIFASNKQDD